MIPHENRAAVAGGLSEAFGVSECEDIRDLTERPGSNRAFRIVVRGSPYRLRINTRPGDMTRDFTCMQAAADAGLAPRVRQEQLPTTRIMASKIWFGRHEHRVNRLEGFEIATL
jgi:hypothetical protein